MDVRVHNVDVGECYVNVRAVSDYKTIFENASAFHVNIVSIFYCDDSFLFQCTEFVNMRTFTVKASCIKVFCDSCESEHM